MRTDLFLALRFVREGLSQTMLLTVAAGVGITVVFFLSALVAAVERTMISQTLDVVPHVVVRRPDEVARPPAVRDAGVVDEDVHPPAQRLRHVENWPAVMARLEAMQGVEAVSPVAAGPGVAARGSAVRSVTIQGIEPERFADVIRIRSRIRSGRLELAGDEAAIGTELAADLGVEVGGRVRVGAAGQALSVFRVAAVFDLGNRDVNERWVLVPLRRAQSLLRIPGGVSSLDVRASDLWATEPLASRIEAETALTAESWTTTNAQLAVAIRSQRGATLMIRVFVMVAVAMGIASVLVVSTVQKARQIGILRAMGLTRGAIQRVFLAQGAFIGVGGSVLGTAAGTGLAFASMAGARNPDGTPTYPIVLPASLYLLAFGIAVSTGLLASVLPARRAASLHPARAIRHE